MVCGADMQRPLPPLEAVVDPEGFATDTLKKVCIFSMVLATIQVQELFLQGWIQEGLLGWTNTKKIQMLLDPPLSCMVFMPYVYEQLFLYSAFCWQPGF